MSKRISIIGSGQVGSRVGAELIGYGNKVIFYDVVEKPELIEEYADIFTTDIHRAIVDTDISIITVPTNLAEGGRHFDYSHLMAAARACGEVLKEKGKHHDFVLKSTVTPGTTEKFEFKIREASGYNLENDEHYDEDLEPVQNFGMVHNPEFLTVISDTWTKRPEFVITPVNEGRIVVGPTESTPHKILYNLEELYKPLGVPLYVTKNSATSESVKLAANSRLALAVSFNNQITELLKNANEKKNLNIDVDEVVKLVHLDPRIGFYGSVFGKAYGGPCFKKDLPVFAQWIKEATGKQATLIEETIGVNNMMTELYGVRE